MPDVICHGGGELSESTNGANGADGQRPEHDEDVAPETNDTSAEKPSDTREDATGGAPPAGADDTAEPEGSAPITFKTSGTFFRERVAQVLAEQGFDSDGEDGAATAAGSSAGGSDVTGTPVAEEPETPAEEEGPGEPEVRTVGGIYRVPTRVRGSAPVPRGPDAEDGPSDSAGEEPAPEAGEAATAALDLGALADAGASGAPDGPAGEPAQEAAEPPVAARRDERRDVPAEPAESASEAAPRPGEPEAPAGSGPGAATWTHVPLPPEGDGDGAATGTPTGPMPSAAGPAPRPEVTEESAAAAGALWPKPQRMSDYSAGSGGGLPPQGPGGPAGPSGPAGSGPGKGKKKAKRKKPLWLRLLLTFLVATGLMVILAGGAFAFFYTTVEVPDAAKADAVEQGSTFFFGDGETEFAYRGTDRDPVSYDEMTEGGPHVVEAVISAEDRGFWTEPGVSVRGTTRAVWSTVTGQQVQGGSTITQQMVRN